MIPRHLCLVTRCTVLRAESEQHLCEQSPLFHGQGRSRHEIDYPLADFVRGFQSARLGFWVESDCRELQ